MYEDQKTALDFYFWIDFPHHYAIHLNPAKNLITDSGLLMQRSFLNNAAFCFIDSTHNNKGFMVYQFNLRF